MSQIEFYTIILAVGFATSGVASSFYQLMTSERPEFLPFSSSLTANVIAILLSMFAGPFIIFRKVWSGITNREMQLPLVALLVVICTLWSFYSGVAVLYITVAIV